MDVNLESKITERIHMLLPMLRAVSQMLDLKENFAVADGAMVYLERVRCANIILQELISNLEENPNPVSKIKPGEKPVLEPKPKLEPMPTVETNGDEWMITVDENKGLKIVDFPLDGLVELDGKKMTYGEARGQVFKKARIL